LFNMATQGNNVAAAIFWMKARAGWREKQEIELNFRPVHEASNEDHLRIIERARHEMDIEGELADAEGEPVKVATSDINAA